MQFTNSNKSIYHVKTITLYSAILAVQIPHKIMITPGNQYIKVPYCNVNTLLKFTLFNKESYFNHYSISTDIGLALS